MAAQTRHCFQTSQDVLQLSSKVKWEETSSKHEKYQPNALPSAIATDHWQCRYSSPGGLSPMHLPLFLDVVYINKDLVWHFNSLWITCNCLVKSQPSCYSLITQFFTTQFSDLWTHQIIVLLPFFTPKWGRTSLSLSQTQWNTDLCLLLLDTDLAFTILKKKKKSPVAE